MLSQAQKTPTKATTSARLSQLRAFQDSDDISRWMSLSSMCVRTELSSGADAQRRSQLLWCPMLLGCVSKHAGAMKHDGNFPRTIPQIDAK